jgi:hypothetical protein
VKHRALPLLLSALIAALATGCSRSEAPPSPPSCPELDAGTPVDTTLLAFLSRARAAHHLADSHEQTKDPKAAVEVLELLLRGPVPGADQPRPEAREVLADTRARVANLQSELGNFEAAMEHVDVGLKLVPTDSYFRGHLFEVRGLVEERRANQLREAGKATEAEAAKQSALAAFEEAMKIQERVIQQAVPAAEPR